MLGGRVLLPAAAGFDPPLARLDVVYTFRLWLTLVLEENAPRFGVFLR